MSLKIGFKTQFHTLWNVSAPYKHYFGNQKFDYEMRTDYMFIQNLAFDKAAAQAKAASMGCNDLEVDMELYGRSSQSFYTTGEKGTDRPDYEFPDGIHRYGFGDIRTMASRPVNYHQVDEHYSQYLNVEDRLADERNQQDIKALWTLYMKKDIVFPSEFQNESEKGNAVRPEWKRPIVYARRRMFELGILVRYDGLTMAASYLPKYKAKQLIKNLKSGHWGTDKSRVELQLMEMDCFGFEGMYGTTYIITYSDEQGQKFKYMGASPAAISNESFTNVKATLAHGEYQGEKETKIKRITIL
jgi:hypothetical protein